MPDVVLTRLLSEAAHRHVLDHACTQRADVAVGKIGGHRGFLSRAEGCWTFDARDRMPRSSRPTVHRLSRSPQAVMCALPRERVRSLPLMRHSRLDRRTAEPGGKRAFAETRVKDDAAPIPAICGPATRPA